MSPSGKASGRCTPAWDPGDSEIPGDDRLEASSTGAQRFCPACSQLSAALLRLWRFGISQAAAGQGFAVPPRRVLGFAVREQKQEHWQEISFPLKDCSLTGGSWSPFPLALLSAPLGFLSCFISALSASTCFWRSPGLRADPPQGDLPLTSSCPHLHSLTSVCSQSRH